MSMESSETGMCFRWSTLCQEGTDNLCTVWELVLVCKFFEADFFSSDYNVVCRKRFFLLFFQM